jgi:hypothetical protein
MLRRPAPVDHHHPPVDLDVLPAQMDGRLVRGGVQPTYRNGVV